MLLEMSVLRTLYARDHLSQVLATFALILIFNEAVRIVWGSDMPLPMPAALSGPVELLPGMFYPAYRLLIIGVGAAVAALLYLLVARTRIGMLVRAARPTARWRWRWASTSAGFSRCSSALARACAPWPARCSGRSSRSRWAWARNILILAFVVHRHRRHRLDPRGAGGGRARRTGGHHRARISADALRPVLPAAGRERRRSGDRLRARVPADGRGAVLQARGLFPARG